HLFVEGLADAECEVTLTLKLRKRSMQHPSGVGLRVEIDHLDTAGLQVHFDLRARDCLKEPRGGSALPGLRIELAFAPVGRFGDEVAAPGSSYHVGERERAAGIAG